MNNWVLREPEPLLANDTVSGAWTARSAAEGSQSAWCAIAANSPFHLADRSASNSQGESAKVDPDPPFDVRYALTEEKHSFDHPDHFPVEIDPLREFFPEPPPGVLYAPENLRSFS
jgi:hypothetical protein